MKILIHSNAPTAPTGYGVQTALLARRLRDDGHDVGVSCTFGLQAGGRKWEGITLYPSGWDSSGNDIIHNHAIQHFGGDPLGGWIIILNDLWVHAQQPLLKDFNVIGWCPVDHFPVPPGVLGFFKQNPDAVPLGMSKFGVEILREAGLSVDYAPLAVDLDKFKPTSAATVGGVERTGRDIIGVSEGTFLVGMAAMNKDSSDRKGFNEAFRAFAEFHREHPESALYVHADPNGMGTGLNLRELAVHCGVPKDSLLFPAAYDLQCGSYTSEMMASLYTAFDVLLAPSRGEGFCVPLIEAQACGTPVIVSDFSAQPELVGAGWKVRVQPIWDQGQRATYGVADIGGLIAALEAAYDCDRSEHAEAAIRFAADYGADRVYAEHWRPLLADLEPADPPELDRSDRITKGNVAVVVPAMKRPHNVAPLVESFPDVAIYFVCDPDDTAEIEAVKAAGLVPLISDRGHTFAQKVNYAYANTDEPWLFVCGDDCRATPGWLDAPAELSDRFDVIGTNDAHDGKGNPRVQSGAHSDHFFIRRSYIDTYGASLDGPGVVAHEGYHHFFVDYEIVELAKARNAFSPCLESVVEHLHPGLGKGRGDIIYQTPTSPNAIEDRETFDSRAPLIAMQRQGRGRSQ